jgi:hypothetical protein
MGITAMAMVVVTMLGSAGVSRRRRLSSPLRGKFRLNLRRDSFLIRRIRGADRVISGRSRSLMRRIDL